MSSERFIQRLQAFIDSEGLLAPDDSVVVGVSGGCDSTALLRGLVEVNEISKAGWRFHVAHLNHGLRGEAADADAEFVRDQAAALGLPCTITTEDVRARAGATGGLEETARDLRYALFQRVALQTHSQAVAVGHHADDNVETVLHRIVRGTGLRGLGGIPVRRALSPGSDVRLIRPLLSFRHEELEAFLADQGVSFRTDATNDDPSFTRNRIRASVLPLLRDTINPGVDKALLRLAEQARWVETYLRETAQRLLETLVIRRTDRELVLNARALIGKSRIIQAELVRQAVMYFQLGEQDLTFGHLTAVLDLAADPASGKQLHLPAGLVVAKEYGRLSFSLPDHSPRETLAPEVSVNLPGETVLPVRRMRVHAVVDEITGTAEAIAAWRNAKPPNQEWLDRDQVHPPLIVRALRPGERFWPLGAPGSKRIADFLSDEKISASKREQVAVLCDQLGPIWVIPFRIDERVKLTRATRRILKLTMQPMPPVEP